MLGLPPDLLFIISGSWGKLYHVLGLSSMKHGNTNALSVVQRVAGCLARGKVPCDRGALVLILGQ